ncbi:MAG TPA: Rieske 2Fe-2S domain-containing protein [Dermatophilaceae bacterium]|nr:Rieske 2Fe-2S domain-containing protein [Dermatophilaceae bacterium]
MSDSTETQPDFVTATGATHHPRRTDVDPRAAKRAERQVAMTFVLAALLILASLVAYVVIPVDAGVELPLLGPVGALNVALGLSLGLGILFIGLGAIHWARKLMPGTEVVAMRHEMRSADEQRRAAVEAFDRGLADSGFTQRPIIRRTLIGAMLVLPLPLVILLRDLYIAPEGAPSPAEQLEQTIWGKNVRIVTDVSLNPVRPEDVPVGGLVAAVPENLSEVEEETGNLNARAKAAIILVRMTPDEIVSQQGEAWDYQGILAFSKICTHVGCPIALYEQRTHHLLCPCHQSTFDLADSGTVVFGPAARQMPQLPITVDDEGYLVAVSDFQQPVGPSFWERS